MFFRNCDKDWWNRSQVRKTFGYLGKWHCPKRKGYFRPCMNRTPSSMYTPTIRRSTQCPRSKRNVSCSNHCQHYSKTIWYTNKYHVHPSEYDRWNSDLGFFTIGAWKRINRSCRNTKCERETENPPLVESRAMSWSIEIQRLELL